MPKRSSEKSVVPNPRPPKRARVNPEDDDDIGTSAATDNIVSPSNAAYSSRILERINFSANLSDDEGGRYAVSSVPHAATWGKGVNDKLLCIDEDPLVVWMMGELHSTWFFNKDGEAQKNINVGFKPARACDYDAATGLLASHATIPNRAAQADRVLYAGKLQARRVRGESGTQAYPFTNAWDAQDLFDVKAAMKRINPAELDVNDLVLVEAHVSRYRCDEDGTRSYAGEWRTWRTSFELVHISLFAQREDTDPEDEIINHAEHPVGF